MSFPSISKDAWKQGIVCWGEECIFSDSAFRRNVFGDLFIVKDFNKHFVLLSFVIATCKNILK